MSVFLAACGGGGQDTDDPTPGVSNGEVTGTVTVLAAASLTESFEALGDRLEAGHPGLDVVFSFGPSSGLVEQVISGARADVLATADERTMDQAVQAGVVVGEPAVFARNSLVLVVPAGNPGDVTELADLARDEPRIAVCEPQVPCGAAAEALLAAGDVVARPDTYATDVKEALALVTLGEADAALVYRTDAVAAGVAVESVDVPESADVVNDYPIVELTDAPNPGTARLVIDAITGEAGQAVLGEAGFLVP
ncbi:MAG TPA: molybdate ABC transporter substrate-binding protein [Jiangellaceae bacterium]